MAKIGDLLKGGSDKEAELMHRLNETIVVQELRQHLGLSMIGNKCHRYLQYNHYDCFVIPRSVRMLRLFNEGHRMEPVLRDALHKQLGIVSKSDQQQVIGFAGHWKGHIDGVGYFSKDSPFHGLVDDIFLEEFKTHNDKSFVELKKLKVKASKPVHYDQMTSYMGYMELPRALYVAYNKNTSEIYVEFVEFDGSHFRELQRKEAEVIMADTLLPRIGNDSPMWFECKLCDAHDVCFGKKPIKQSCKNCEHVDIHDGGLWTCGKGRSLKDFKACEDYQLMVMLCQ